MSAGWSSQCSSSVWSSGTDGGRNLKEAGTEIDLNWCPLDSRQQNLTAGACSSVSALRCKSQLQIDKQPRGGKRRWRPYLWKRPRSWRWVCSQRWRTAAARFYRPLTRRRHLPASRTRCHLWCSHLQRREQHHQPLMADSKGNTARSRQKYQSLVLSPGRNVFWFCFKLEAFSTIVDSIQK